MLLKKLQGINDPEGLINISAKRQVINQFMADKTFFVDQEQTTERDAVRQQHSVIRGDGFCDIRDKGELHRANTALVHGCVFPGQVSVYGVNRDPKHLAVFGLEIFKLPVKGQNLRGADKGKIQGIKENQDIFTPI